jgi:membrane protease YdiL (CAAX protease family)
MHLPNEILSTILQILGFALIPLLVWLFTKRDSQGFLKYIGLKRSTKKANLLAVAACLIFVVPLLVLTLASPDFREIMFDPHSVTGKFRQMEFGINTLLILLIIALLKTALAEEIFFRGFVAKRLISVTGFVRGNLIQAAIFGAVHAALFAMVTGNLLFLFVIFLFPALGAYISVYLNEKLAGGSIIPGWISHALANVLAYGIVGFLM